MTGGLRCLKAGPAAVSDMVSAQLTESDFQTHPSTTANKVVSFYGVTDRHNDSFLCDNIQFFAYRKTCTPSCHRTT